MRKTIKLALGAAISFIAVNTLATPVILASATPPASGMGNVTTFIATGCSWMNMGGGRAGGTTTTVTGLWCDGAGPILTQVVNVKDSGEYSCALNPNNPSIGGPYTYSSPLTCNNYSVSANRSTVSSASNNYPSSSTASSSTATSGTNTSFPSNAVVLASFTPPTAATAGISPVFLAPNCSWNIMSTGPTTGPKVTTTGLFCDGATVPAAVQTVVVETSGASSCHLSPTSSTNPLHPVYIYSSPFTCNNFSVAIIRTSSTSTSSNSSSSNNSSSSLSSSSAVSSVAVSSASPVPVTVNVDRSLFVHDLATLTPVPIRLIDVMNQLATQMNAINTATAAQINGTQLFGRMWNQQRSLPNGNCTGSVNGWSAVCRNSEGAQASSPELHIDRYQVIGLVNRFDLRDNFSFNDCGEYRIIFARTDGQRNFIIFEALVPNPTPGVASGCRPIQQFWQGLTTQNTPSVRSQLLRDFYFNGLPAAGVRAPIDIRNYSQNTGQIRTNQFMEPTWLLKEYKVSTASGVSTLNLVSDKSNPVANLFNVNNLDPRAVAFRSDFVANLPSLLINNLSTFSLTITNDAHNNGQSHASGSAFVENNFLSSFTANSRNSSFDTAIRNRLTELGSSLTVDQVLNRATAMTCGGCHQPSAYGLTSANTVGPSQSWPDSGFFVHVNEISNSSGAFPLSPALINVFLPTRKLDMESFLNNPASTGKPGQTTPTAPTGKRSG